MQSNRNTKDVQPQQATRKVAVAGGKKSNVISNKMLVEYTKNSSNHK